MQNSRPFFKKIEMLRAQIAALKEEKEGIKQLLNEPNKIIASLKARISEQKGAETTFDSSAKVQTTDLTIVNMKIDKCLERTKEQRKKKLDLRETFYGSMCDYEIEQALIKDIEWIKSTKEMVVERSQRAEKYKQE